MQNVIRWFVAIIHLLIVSPLFSQENTKDISNKYGAVVSAHPLSSEAGMKILRMGGNAIDAAIAVEFALAVVYPQAGNIGGGGFALVRLKDGTMNALDYREIAPLKASEKMYIEKDGSYAPEKSRMGHLAIGVPGTVAGIEELYKKYGSLPFQKLVQPAIDLAENGFQVTELFSHDIYLHRSVLSPFSSSKKYFFPNGDSTKKWKVGEWLVQKDLALTLKRISTKGSVDFYRGETASMIIEEMHRGGGIITKEDLENYKPTWRKPITTTYRGLEVISMPPPSSGGIILFQLLKVLEKYDVQKMGWHTPETVHLMCEAMKRMYADRSEYLGDPDFYNVPIKGLLDSTYISLRMKNFSVDSVSKKITPGDPFQHMQTTHYSVVDKQGNAVSTTTTLNGSFGSGVSVTGAGFLLNNEMDDFSAAPGTPNMYGVVGGKANAIQPKKRMLSSMTPTIVTKNGRLYLTLGSPGGSTIPTTVFQVLTNIVDFNQTAQRAVSSRRFHHQWTPKVIFYELKCFSPEVIAELEKKGWTFKERVHYGRAEVILLDEKTNQLQTGADPRGNDTGIVE